MLHPARLQIIQWVTRILIAISILAVAPACTPSTQDGRGDRGSAAIGGTVERGNDSPAAAASTTTIPTPTTTPVPAELTLVKQLKAGDLSESPPGQEEVLPEVDLTYEIDATLEDFDTGRVTAVSTTRITNREEEPLSHLFFRVAPAHDDLFTLHTIKRNGALVDVIVSDEGTTLEIPLDPTLSAGQTTELIFSFTLNVQSTGNAYSSTTRDGPVLRLGYWYPMLSNDDGYPPLLDPPFTHSADFHVSFTAPTDVIVAAPSDMPSRRSGGAVRYTSVLEQARDFALMLSREYEVDERVSASGIEIALYTLPALDGRSGSMGDDMRDRAFVTAERALADYEERIGPYPWRSLTIADGGPSLGGGIEYTALTAITFDTPAIESLVAHEVAHMWFYAIIGTRTQHDPWIDEGAATFLADGLLYGYGASSTEAMTFAVPLDASVYDMADLRAREWIPAVYDQGGRFYAAVYRAMGREAFWEAMSEIYATQAFDIATPWEVLSIFQHHSPTDLRPLYQEYFTYDWIEDLGRGQSGECTAMSDERRDG